MTESTASERNVRIGWIRTRRWLVRVFSLVMLLLIAIETLPHNFQGKRIATTNYLKDCISPATRRLGLWQGEWPLFAPNPVLNNAWISAECESPEGSVEVWNSPYWATQSGWEKFRSFRQMNYYTRMPFRGKAAINDFADYAARQQISSGIQPTEQGSGNWQLRLFRNQLNIVIPDDGALPSREEALWVSTSVNLTTREYQP